jgi:hypothetical protein
MIGIFDGEEQLLAACRAARDGDVEIHDAYTPYAVHGLDEAMGLRRSRLAQVCFWLGALGCATALGFQLWATTVDWPVNIGGKSFSALPALIPITFEVTVLFAALGTVLVFFLRTRLFPGKGVTLSHPSVTDDRFVLVLEAGQHRTEAREILATSGAVEITDGEVVE